MGVDVCYTNHAEADQDDMDDLLTLLAVAGVSFVITVPGADDVMLGYQSLAFHDALYVRRAGHGEAEATFGARGSDNATSPWAIATPTPAIAASMVRWLRLKV